MKRLTRDGSGKLKGRRNHRRAKMQQFVWRRIEADMHAADWRYNSRLFAIDEVPKTIQFADIQKALKW